MGGEDMSPANPVGDHYPGEREISAFPGFERRTGMAGERSSSLWTERKAPKLMTMSRVTTTTTVRGHCDDIDG